MAFKTPLTQEIIFQIGKRILRSFEKKTKNGIEANSKTLKSIIEENHDTEYGRAYQLRHLKHASDYEVRFTNSVPLTEYTSYQSFIRKIARGQKSVLCAAEVTALAGSAGTTSAPKQIPRTKQTQVNHIRLVVFAAQAALIKQLDSRRIYGKGVNLMNIETPRLDADGSKVPIISGPSAGLTRLKRLAPSLWTMPLPGYEIRDTLGRNYIQALFALKDRNLRFVQAPFAHHVISWLDTIVNYAELLATDLRTGTISKQFEIPDETRSSLEKLLQPDPSRAKDVEASRKDFQPIVTRLWPSLAYVRTVTTGSFEVHKPQLRRYFGNNVALYAGCHSSSEGIIGINHSDIHGADYTLAIGTSYFEFLPLRRTSGEKKTVHSFKDLNIGEDYEIVITSRSGLYRYRLNDIVRISGFYNETPTYQVVGRLNGSLNYAGDKTTDWHCRTALENTLAEFNISPERLRGYSVSLSEKARKPRYEFYVEVAGAADCKMNLDGHEASSVLDCKLRETNPYYQYNARETLVMKGAKLSLLRRGAISSLVEFRKRRVQAEHEQTKVPQLLTNPEDIQFIRNQQI